MKFTDLFEYNESWKDFCLYLRCHDLVVATYNSYRLNYGTKVGCWRTDIAETNDDKYLFEVHFYDSHYNCFGSANTLEEACEATVRVVLEDGQSAYDLLYQNFIDHLALDALANL